MEYKMYIFVNTDLKMGKGKIASQVGHVVQEITHDIILNFHTFYDLTKLFHSKNEEKLFKTYQNYNYWNETGSQKIVLKATEQQIRNIIDKYPKITKYILDAGKTQIEPNSLTVCAFYPMDKANLPHDISHYKLL